MTIHMVGPKNPHKDAINTTSRSPNDWSRGLSPFFLGPMPVYGGYVAKVFENLWQYSKVYPQHVKDDGEPDQSYFQWAIKGWLSERAVRYPMGKGVIPAYSLWDGQKLSYVEARKKIYAPLYAKAVEQTPAFQQLKDIYQKQGEIWLWDFDAYDHLALKMSYQDVIDCNTRKMGHCFILGGLLEGNRFWESV